MADCTQFLSENHLNACQIFGRFGFVKSESEPNFSFPHIRRQHTCLLLSREHTLNLMAVLSLPTQYMYAHTAITGCEFMLTG